MVSKLAKTETIEGIKHSKINHLNLFTLSPPCLLQKLHIYCVLFLYVLQFSHAIKATKGAWSN